MKKLSPNWIVAAILLISISINFLLIRQAYLKETDEELKWIYYSEEHFNLGVTHYKTGEITVNGYPNVLRLPGYPYYVSGVLHLRDWIIGITPDNQKPFYGSVVSSMLEDNQHTIVLSQIIILAIAGLVFYSILSKFASKKISYIFLAIFLLNPNSLSLIMRVDYSIFDLLCILLLILTTIPYFAKDKLTFWEIFALGIVIGASNLIRAVFIIYPFFIVGVKLLLAWRNWRVELKQFALILLFAFLVVSPYTYRNYRVTGKFILTGTQGYVELYHISAANFFKSPEYAEYGHIWTDFGLPLFKKSTGDTEYLGAKWYQYGNLTRLAFIREALSNIKAHPDTYISNVVFNMKTLLLSRLEIWGQKMFKNNSSHEIGRISFTSYLWVTHILGLIGIAAMVFIKPFRNYRLPILFMGLFLLISYSLVYQDPRYTYIKMPIYLLSIGFVCNWLTTKGKIGILKYSAVVIGLLVLVWGVVPLFYFFHYLNLYGLILPS